MVQVRSSKKCFCVVWEKPELSPLINFLANGEKIDIQEQIKKLQQARFPQTAQI